MYMHYLLPNVLTMREWLNMSIYLQLLEEQIRMKKS